MKKDFLIISITSMILNQGTAHSTLDMGDKERLNDCNKNVIASNESCDSHSSIDKNNNSNTIKNNDRPHYETKEISLDQFDDYTHVVDMLRVGPPNALCSREIRR